MRVIVTGTGDAFSAERFGSSALIETADGYATVDCPASPLTMYRRAGESIRSEVDPGRITDFIMTHLHTDHAGGLETMAFFRRYLRGDSGMPRLWAAKEVMARMWERLAPSMDGRGFTDTPASTLDDFFVPGVLDPHGETRVGSLRVQMRWATHAIPTVGLLISDGTATLGWSGDTEFDRKHVQWLSQADLIIHECGESAKHTTYEELATLPEDVQQRIHLLHVPDGVTLPEGPMKRLHDGDVLEIAASVSKGL